MVKVFALLLAEFRKLGATIIFANFSKVIIDTGKSDLSAAKAYCDSLLKTLQTRLVSTKNFQLDLLLVFHPVILSLLICRDLFEWIELEPLNFWHSLLFMDQVWSLASFL
jgi:DNA polymerase epsilon subunit 1